MSDILKSKHGFGKSSGLDQAIASGALDAYDILFLDGETAPKVGWIDKNGNVVIAEGKDQVIKVDELPTENGDDSVIYLYNHEAYVWDGTQCVSMTKSADLTVLEGKITNLETQISNKADTSEVQTMVDAAVEAAVEEAVSSEVVEF